MDRMLAPLLAAHPGLTGVRPLLSGEDAFAARLALIEAAERTIDAQYYIWRDDLTGRVLLDALVAAAARGVRVRVLLDDHHTSGLDRVLAELDAHPTIEVRLFNPFSRRILRSFGLLTDFTRLNRRMHNKSLTADGVLTVVGGRNIGDEYFAATRTLGFVDLDVLAIGPAATEVSQAFEAYWRSAASIRAQRLLHWRGQAWRNVSFARELAAARGREAADYLAALRRNPLSHFVAESGFQWAAAKLVVDPPAKVFGRAARRVRVLTNALESTDVVAVHAAYARYRRALLEGGVQLFELRRAALGALQPRAGVRAGSHASLHAKVFAVDGDRLCIGSFNFDWRSAFFNTELGLLLHSPLAATLSAAFDEYVPRAAYRVTLDARGRLRWQVEGATQVHEVEPGTSWSQRAIAGLLRWAPFEAML
ncbi:MAG: phospholipase D family protein [Gammaproteobacteria bacterium]|nr:phospholipase D family protein [Gammaproteobacteria bacterium]